MNRIKVAILFGGVSEEHDVSAKSAMELAANINAEKYEPFYIGITKTGCWKMCEKPNLNWEEGVGYPVVFSPESGEDGKVQGLLELSGIPYVGCGVQSSVICMDKSLAYLVAQSAGIAVPQYQIIPEGDTPDAAELSYPVFVKPARSGSSFGVSKVDKADHLYAAIVEARKFDGKVLIEQAISGCEVGCAILGNTPDLIVGEVDQIRLKHGFFRIHQEAQPEKGLGNAAIKVPAELSAETRKQIQKTAAEIYQALGCQGLSRVDLFLQEDGHIVLNEVNTMPGFTSYSRYPRMMAAAGLPLADVFDSLIELALRR